MRSRKKRILALLLALTMLAGDASLAYAAEEPGAETVTEEETAQEQTEQEEAEESAGPEEQEKTVGEQDGHEAADSKRIQENVAEKQLNGGLSDTEAREDIVIYLVNDSVAVTIDMTPEEYKAGISVDFDNMEVCNGYNSYYREEEQKLYLEFRGNMEGETDIDVWNSERSELLAAFHATATYEELPIYMGYPNVKRTNILYKDTSPDEWELVSENKNVCTGSVRLEEYPYSDDGYKECYLDLQGLSQGTSVIKVKRNDYVEFAYRVVVNPLPDNVVLISDDRLQQSLRTQGFDKDSNGLFTKEELAQIEYLYLNNSSISDLTGLEWAVNLQSIYLSGSKDLKNIDALFELENLEYIDLSSTGVSMEDRMAIADIQTERNVNKGDKWELVSNGAIFDTFPEVSIVEGEDLLEYSEGVFLAKEAGTVKCEVTGGTVKKELLIHIDGIESDQEIGDSSDLGIQEVNKNVILDSNGILWQMYPEVTRAKENVKSYAAGWIYSGEDALEYQYALDNNGILWSGDEMIASDVAGAKGHYALGTDHVLTDIYNTQSIRLENVADWVEGLRDPREGVYNTYVLKEDGTLWGRMEVEKNSDVNEFQLAAEGVSQVTKQGYLKESGEYCYFGSSTPYLSGVSEVEADPLWGQIYWYYGKDGNCYMRIYSPDSGWHYADIGKVRIKETASDGYGAEAVNYYLTEEGVLYQYLPDTEDIFIDEEVVELKQTIDNSVYKKADGLYRYCSTGKAGTVDEPVYINLGYVLEDQGIPGDYNLLMNGVELLTHVKDIVEGYAVRTDGTVWDVSGVPRLILDLDTGMCVRGDADGDGKADISDLRLVLRHVCKKTELTGTAFKAADVTDDGDVDIQDLRKILRFVCKKITEL